MDDCIPECTVPAVHGTVTITDTDTTDCFETMAAGSVYVNVPGTDSVEIAVTANGPNTRHGSRRQRG